MIHDVDETEVAPEVNEAEAEMPRMPLTRPRMPKFTGQSVSEEFKSSADYEAELRIKTQAVDFSGQREMIKKPRWPQFNPCTARQKVIEAEGAVLDAKEAALRSRKLRDDFAAQMELRVARRIL